MYGVILFLFMVVLFAGYGVAQGWLPNLASYLPELTAIAVAAYVVGAGVQDSFRYVRLQYWLVFGMLTLVVVCGLLVNALEPGPLFAGLRTYLRAMPLLFLPAVLSIDDRRLRTQLTLLLAASLVQFPVAFVQRMQVLAENRTSGDSVVGTLVTSPMLSVFLICAACVLTGLYLRKRLRAAWFFPLFLLVLAPTTLNETKATLVLLPAGLFTAFIVGSPRGAKIRNGIVATGALAVFGAIFVPVYDYFMKPRWGYGLIDFLTMEGRVERYLMRGAEVGEQEAGKLDGIVVPLTELSREPAWLVFGLGVGNASDSALGEQFTGEYFRRFEPFLQSTASVVMLELGVLGLALVLMLYFMIFRDARVVARRDPGLTGAFAVGWSGAVAVMALATFYTEMMASSALSFLFWYFSGVVMARRMRLAEPAARPVLQPQSAAHVPLRGERLGRPM